MNGPSVADMALLAPELILVGIALVLVVAARRLRSSAVPVIATVVAALAACFVCGWILSSEPKIGFGGMFTVDGYSQFFKVLIAATLVLVALLSVKSFERDNVPRGEYHALLLLASTGMMLSVSALDLLSLYLGLELTTLCAYILVGITVDKPTANEAAIKYFLLGSFASALLLFGMALTYGLTGTTDFAGIAQALTDQGPASSPLLLVGIGLVAAGLAFKISAVPFHAWSPDAYEGASAPVAALLATGSKVAGLAALGRVCQVAFASQEEVLTVVLVVLAGLSILVGSVIAVSQTDMKRLLAYSSIAHAGYALLGLVGGPAGGATATMTYAFLYVFMTLGAFGVVIALGRRGESLDGYQGLAAQRPVTAAIMLLFLLSLTGLPPTAGFAAKFVVITSAIRADQVVLAVLAVVCTVVTAFVYLRIAVFMYMKEPQQSQQPEPSRVPAAVTVALAVAALVTLIGGVFPGILTAWVVSP